MSILNAVLAAIREQSRRSPALAIFDLDSTILSTQPRNWAILNEFASRPDVPSALRPVVEKLGPDDMGWNIMEDVRSRGFHDEDVLKALRQFWFERFFNDDYLHHDEPVPGAVEFVRDTHAAGGTIVYLTGRDEPKMGRGTRASLRTRGFPIDDDRIVLRLKPRFEDEDLAFKRSTLAELASMGEVVATFENEPANANLFHQTFPRAHHLFLETVHSPNPPPLLPGILRLKDFVR
jgi:hypothetical protein